MSTKKRIIGKSLESNKINKPDTAMRAGITADLKFTRGKQLVEQSPFNLIPDPQNPRPGEIIDDNWLISNLKLCTSESLCRGGQDNKEYIIPDISDLQIDYNEALEEDYNFLKGLAESIRIDGLIEPIEIFLADKINDPEYFLNSDREYGYVVLEGHQRRLAAMMAGVSTVTCIEITDETTLAKLKVKHRKLRRQLSENNLRKGLTVSQNFKIVRELLTHDPDTHITSVELSSIIGLNIKIAEALLCICKNIHNYPPSMFSRIDNNQVTFKQLRRWAFASKEAIENDLKSGNQIELSKAQVKPRGRSGGAVKKSATFKIKNETESVQLQKFLLSRIPEIKFIELDFTFKGLENLLNKIKELAADEMS